MHASLTRRVSLEQENASLGAKYDIVKIISV